MSHLLLRRILQVTTGTLAGLAVVAIVYLGFPGLPGTAGGPEGGADLAVPEPYPAPELSLHTAEGDPYGAEDLRGDVTVVFFGFTHCPDICPITLRNLTQALEQLEASGRSFRTVFVSVDPRRDTPDVLRRYMESFHPSFTALTGSEEELASVVDAWGIHVVVQEEGTEAHPGHAPTDPTGDPSGQHPPGHAETAPEEGYGVIHSTRALVVDRQGYVVASLAAWLTPTEIVAALEPLLR